MWAEPLPIAWTGGELTASPFPHIYAPDFFEAPYLSALQEDLRRRLSGGLDPNRHPERFRPLGTHHDAWTWIPRPEDVGPLSLFRSPAWWRWISARFPHLMLTRDVVTEYHHHLVGSRAGFVHSDFTTCDFPDNQLSDGMNPWFYGSLRGAAARPAERVMRSVAVLLYLGPGGWQEGDGGETGLYGSAARESLGRRVPPLPNSLLLFEITPRSYHRFLYKRRLERNSVIQWFHEPMAEKLARHPGSQPVYNNFG